MPGKATSVLFSDKLVWPHLEVVHWFALNFIKNIYFVICFFCLVLVTYGMRVQCYLCTNPIPSRIPLPGRTAHRTAGISLGSTGPRPNIKGNTPNSGIKPEGSTFQHILCYAQLFGIFLVFNHVNCGVLFVCQDQVLKSECSHRWLKNVITIRSNKHQSLR